MTSIGRVSQDLWAAFKPWLRPDHEVSDRGRTTTRTINTDSRSNEDRPWHSNDSVPVVHHYEHIIPCPQANDENDGKARESCSDNAKSTSGWTKTLRAVASAYFIRPTFSEDSANATRHAEAASPDKFVLVGESPESPDLVSSQSSWRSRQGLRRRKSYDVTECAKQALAARRRVIHQKSAPIINVDIPSGRLNNSSEELAHRVHGLRLYEQNLNSCSTLSVPKPELKTTTKRRPRESLITDVNDEDRGYTTDTENNLDQTSPSSAMTVTPNRRVRFDGASSIESPSHRSSSVMPYIRSTPQRLSTQSIPSILKSSRSSPALQPPQASNGQSHKQSHLHKGCSFSTQTDRCINSKEYVISPLGSPPNMGSRETFTNRRRARHDAYINTMNANQTTESDTDTDNELSLSRVIAHNDPCPNETFAQGEVQPSNIQIPSVSGDLRFAIEAIERPAGEWPQSLDENGLSLVVSHDNGTDTPCIDHSIDSELQNLCACVGSENSGRCRGTFQQDILSRPLDSDSVTLSKGPSVNALEAELEEMVSGVHEARSICIIKPERSPILVQDGANNCAASLQASRNGPANENTMTSERTEFQAHDSPEVSSVSLREEAGKQMAQTQEVEHNRSGPKKLVRCKSARALGDVSKNGRPGKRRYIGLRGAGGKLNRALNEAFDADRDNVKGRKSVNGADKENANTCH